uniref:Uncharacterized protein n=1 Tax=Anguilla anguilla TaxID=7936 RepID=A0A0E9U2S6_ANGAN
MNEEVTVLCNSRCHYLRCDAVLSSLCYE